MPIARSDRTGRSRRCCCPENEFCYLLSECDESTTCPDNGVYVSEPALNYMLEVLLPSPPPIGYPIVIQFHDGCCLYADATTIDTQYIKTDVIAAGGYIIYSETEGQPFRTIQDYQHIEECEVCEEVPTGACCYFFRNQWQCEDDATQAECDDLPQGKWFGKGSECSDQDCTDPDPNCPSKFGLCLCTDVDGVNVPTLCDDLNEDCSTTYSISITVPSFNMYHGGCMPCGGQECPPNDCSGYCEQGCCCDSGMVSGTSFQTTLTQQEIEGELKSRWLSPDDTGDHPPNQVPSGGNKTFGGTIDGNWITYPSQPCWGATPCDDTGTCIEETCRCEPCASAANYECPCCFGYQLKSWWYNATVYEIAQSCGDCPSGLDFLCCSPPCSIWIVKLSFWLTFNGCEGTTYCGESCDENKTCDPDNYGATMLAKHPFFYYVKMDGCTCPVMGSGDASWNPLSNLDFPPSGSDPSIGIDGHKRLYPSCSQCGCKNWMYAGYNGQTDALPFVNGVSWIIS